jgi:hypothetical protein
MAHQGVFVQQLTREAIPPAIKRNAMIPDDTGYINPLVQSLVSSVAVQLKLVSENHRPF